MLGTKTLNKGIKNLPEFMSSVQKNKIYLTYHLITIAIQAESMNIV
jgi:hypothetical protein